MPRPDWKTRFLMLEIETGLANAKLAAEAYRSGRKRDGDTATARAIRAMQTGRLFITELDVSDQEAVRTKLLQLKQAIEEIDIS